jgi:hypothetical protein
MKPQSYRTDRTLGRLTQSSRTLNQNTITTRKQIGEYFSKHDEDNFHSIQSDIQRKLKSLSKEMGSQEFDVSAQQSLNVTGVVHGKKVSDSKTTVK